MARDLMADYLDRLAAALPDGRGIAPVLAEVEDGLLCAWEKHLAAGEDPHRAAQLSAAEFGEPEDLAAEFAPVLAVSQVHRYGITLLATGPVVGGPWLAAVILTSSATSVVVLAVVVAVLLVLVPCTVFAVAASGRLGHRFGISARRAATAVVVATTGAAAVDAALIAVGPVALVMPRPSGPVMAVTLVAALASAVRLSATVRASHRLRRSRSML
jgi:hypothetical protein